MDVDLFVVFALMGLVLCWGCVAYCFVCGWFGFALAVGLWL